MQISETRCSKCGGEMESGFLVDTIYPGNAFVERQGENLLWARGNRPDVPKPGLLSRLANGIGFLFSSVEKKPVESLRCTHCGYLELYAH